MKKKNHSLNNSQLKIPFNESVSAIIIRTIKVGVRHLLDMKEHKN